MQTDKALHQNRKTRRQELDQSTNREDIILDELVNLTISRYTWENLPEGLTSEILENMLIQYGLLGGVKLAHGGIVILPIMGTSNLNVYGQHLMYEYLGMDGMAIGEVSIDDVVKLKNNYTETGDLDNLRIYAKRLSDLERSQDVNLFQQTIPKIFITDEEGKLTLNNIIQSVRNFKYCIMARKGLTAQIQKSEILDNTAPYLLDKMQEQKQALWCEILTILGIENNNVNKRERLVTDEVNANNEFTNINLDIGYDMRTSFCEEFNEKFGMDITVNKREVEGIEPLHNDDKTDN